MNAIAVRTKHLTEQSCYLTEQSLVNELSSVVKAKNGPVHCREVAHEFDYASGRTDVLGLGGQDEVHAFETKLSKWRDALDQARRNTCFAHYCYVALPVKAANTALKFEREFVRHGVGLIVLGMQQAKLAIKPRRNDPLLPWLTKAALAHFGDE
ncbi:MAG TPA: hypothetical protein VN784_11385 [Candidatus Limnocylindrales bacterium]|nr:hypothetical protein [Candidatus Limnocylindrales bacterium]